MNGRQAILNKIRDAVKIPSEIKSVNNNLDDAIKKGIASVTPKSKDELWAQFKKELETINGEFYSVTNISQVVDIIAKLLTDSKFDRVGISKEYICHDIAERIQRKIQTLQIISPEKLDYEKRKKEFAVTEAAIVNPVFAVADIGSLVFLYDQTGTTYPHFLCDNTFVIINQNQIVANQFDLFENLDQSKTKNMVFVTGPSRTADIEKVLVLGAHGPRKLAVIVYSEE